MAEFKRISAVEANELIAANAESHVVDIRDENAFNAFHINNAIHLNNANVQEFILNAEFETPLIIYCYHGISSQNAAHMFAEQGFEEVYSVDGGYEAWQTQPPA